MWPLVGWLPANTRHFRLCGDLHPEISGRLAFFGCQVLYLTLRIISEHNFASVMQEEYHHKKNTIVSTVVHIYQMERSYPFELYDTWFLSYRLHARKWQVVVKRREA